MSGKALGEISATPFPRRVRGGSALQPREGGTVVRLSLLIVALLLAAPLAKGSLTIVSASGGITITAGSGSFGNVNGLGVGTAPTGTSLITSGPTNGVAYTTPYGLQIAGAFTNVTVTAYVSSNFSQPTILILYSCPYSGGCTSWSGYSPLSKNSAQPTNIISTAVGNGTYTAYLGLFVSNANGTAVTGTESATITFTATTVILGYSFTFATAILMSSSAFSVASLGVL